VPVTASQRSSGSRRAGQPRLAPALLEALGGVRVASDCRSGSVGGRAFEARSTGEFTFRLSRAIYEVLHVGWLAEPTDRALTRRDQGFEARLLAATPHKLVLRTASILSADPRQIRVELDGVRVIIPRAQAEPAEDDLRPGGQVNIRLPSCRPALSPGYWVTDGTRALAARDRIVRLYIHLRTADAVVAAWPAVLAALEERGLAYRAKVTSVPELLPRRDALVVYAGDRDLAAVTGLAGQLGHIAGLGADVSPFTEQLGDGAAIAWEPDDDRPAMRGLSFGEHRARASAEALVSYAGSDQRESLAETIRLALITARIDPACPARNRP
jgi:type III HopA1-like effector protein